MQNYTITKAQGDIDIYVDLVNSAAGRSISRQPYLLNLVKDVVKTIELTKSKIFIERDMGRVIGNTEIVETTDKDAVFYAQQNKKTVFSRFVKNRNLKASTYLTICMKRDDKGNYEIKDLWIGPLAPPFPGDDEETKDSKTYWETHALIFGTQNIQSKTITKTCPY